MSNRYRSILSLGSSTPPFSNVNSFSFDGIDDYFLVPDTSGLSFGNGTTDSPFSFSTWVKMTDATRFYVLSKGLVFSSNYEYLLNTNASDKIGLYLYDSSNNSRIGRFYNTPLTTYENQWIHICSTYNGSGLSSGIKVYLNGVRVDDTNSNSGTYVAMENGNRSLNIGRTETGLYSSGLIDETAIFTTELSASDVSAIYNNGEPQSLDTYSPFVWFRMGDNATWNGATWTMTSVGTDTRIARSINMVEANRTTDVPPNPFANTLSTYFDGVDDRVEINNTLTNGYAELSVSTWVKYNNNLATSNQYHPIVARQGSPGNSFVLQNMRSGASSNGGELYFGVNTPNGTFNAFSGVVPSQNVWYNIVGTYDGSNVKIYIDGVLKATTSASGNINTNNTILYLGDSGFGGFSQILNGNLDEVSIYSRGLTQSEVTDIFGQGVPSDVSSISNIEAYWRMGDGDTAPTLTDNVGSNNGTMVNMNASNFVTDVPTAPSFTNTKSILLDGVDDFVNIGTTSLGITNTISISAWVKIPTSNTGGGGSNIQEIICEDATSSSNRNWALNWRGGANNNWQWVIWNANGSVTVVTSTGLTPNDNQWHHILATYDGTSNADGVKLYIDGGTPFTATASSTGIRSVSSVEATIGAMSGGSALRLEGTLDEIAVWDSDQSANASTIYNSGVPNDISSLSPLSWWRCGDGDTAPTLTDNGSGGNDGTMTNFSTFSTDVPSSFTNTKSILLDGVDDFVTMGNVLNMADDGTDSFSCSFWMKSNSFNTEMIVSKQLNSGSYNGFSIYIVQGRLNFFIGSGTSPNSKITGRSTNYVIGSNWNNVVLTYDGSQDISGFNIYINGVSDSIVTLSNNTPTKVSNTTDFQLSGRAGGANLLYGGGLDEVAFWNGTELTSIQASEIGSTLPTDLSTYNPTSWWRCGDGDTAPTLTDNGSASNDGTMTNFTTFSTDVPT